MNAQKEDDQQKKKGSAIEWIVAALGGLLLLGTVFYLAFEGVAGSKTEPNISVVPARSIPAEGGYVVPFVAKNAGSSTGATVVIEGTLSRGGAVIERTEATLDYLPGHSERQGGLFFSQNPAEADIKLRALGYTEP